MKKYFILAASILAALSCTKENLNSADNSNAEGELSACSITATNSCSKTCIGTVSSDNISILWEEGDAVKVWDDISGCTGHEFKMSSISSDHSGATFNGEVHSLATGLNVIYPASSVTGTYNSLSASIPATQTMKNGSFDSSAAISIAHATRTPGQEDVSGLTFKNLCAVICFNVPSYITKVVISANNGAYIAGEVTIDPSNDALSLSGTNLSKTITVNTTASTAQFYAVIAPGTYTGGFTFDMTADNGATYTKSTTKELPALAGRIFNLGNLELKLDISSVNIEHEYMNNILQGSKITIKSGNTNEQNGLVKNWKVTLKKDGLADQVFNLSSMTSSAGAYIPQGSYSATIEYSFADGSSRTVEGIQTTVPAPVFNMTIGGHTSYDTYISSGASAANNEDGSTIYGLSATVSGISNSVLAQSNVGYSLKAMLNGEVKVSTSSSSIATVDLTGMGWTSYTVSGTATFDGIVKNGTPYTVHVTGLPYNKSNSKAYNYKNDWSWTDNGSWKDDNYLNWYLATVNFKGFHIPANINATVSYRFKNYSGASIKGYLKCTAGETLFLDKTTTSKLIWYTWDEFKGTGKVTFSSSKNSIQCVNTGGSGATSGSVTAQMFYLGVIYR